MSSSGAEVLKTIVHYQECLEKYVRKKDEAKMLYCIGKLWKLPVTIDHLTETGVGRTVNSLRKSGGDVGDRAKSLVTKWKEMVAQEEDDEEIEQNDVQASTAHDVTENIENEEEEDVEDESYVIDESKSEDTSKEDERKFRNNSNEPSLKHSSMNKEDHSKHNKRHKDTHKDRYTDIDRNKEHGTNKHTSKKDSHVTDNKDKHKHKSSKDRRETNETDKYNNKPSKQSHKLESDSDDCNEKVVKHKHKEDDKEKVSKRKHSDFENNHKHESDSDDPKHKVVKRKHVEDNKEKSSKHSRSDHETRRKYESDSDNHKHGTPKQKHKEDGEKGTKRKHSEPENNHKSHVKPDKIHYKSHKKKYDSDIDEEQDDEEEEQDVRDDSSEESGIEEKEVKKHSSKSHHKEEKHKGKDKHRSKDEDKKDHNHKSKSSTSSKDKDKTKHSSRDKIKDNSKSKHSSKHSSSKKDESHKKQLLHATKNKTTNVTDAGIGSGCGTSFAEALGMLEPPSISKVNKKKAVTIPSSLVDNDSSDISSPEQSSPEINLLTNKKLEPLNINIASLLPEITPNYKPMGYPILDGGAARNRVNTEDETLSAIMYNKISRTKVYSGNKVAWGVVPSLFDLCTRVLQDNIDALEFTGGVPYSILKPVIERANYNQLFMLEQYNPYLMEDTDELWQLHCQRDFRSKNRDEMETWRDMYQRCLEERESKLRALTANIKHSQDKSIPVRQTKLAYVDSVVKPPRNIARKQAKHGTGGLPASSKKPIITPSSRLVELATVGVSSDAVVPNPGPRAAVTSTPNVVVKPKKAPLMQKTLALMKNRFRR